MAKKGNYSKPIGDMPTKQSIRDSKSYKRVKNNGNFEGIFLIKASLSLFYSVVDKKKDLFSL